MSYEPKFTITNEILNLVAEISALAGDLSKSGGAAAPSLRRSNRIKTVHASLAIEQNTLTLEQVTAVLQGKRVIAPERDIAEVRNAFAAYDSLGMYDPFSCDDLLEAHGIMMKGLVDEAGAFRSVPAGVADSSGRIIHFGTLPQYVPQLMSELLAWLENTDVHPLVAGCVFHFELENIHPFIDGNGRIGRLWHTLILSKWNSTFAWLPVESIVHRRQKAYYDAINMADAACDSTVFIVFMLKAIKEAILESGGSGRSLEESLLKLMRKDPDITIAEMAGRLGRSESTIKRAVAPLKAKGTVRREGSRKSGRWAVK